MGAGLGFLESLAYTGDIKEAGMNALINGFLQVATMPSMREYHRQIAKNNTIADMAEYYVDNGVVKNVQEGQKIAEEVLDRALKLGDEAFKPENQRVILDRVLKGESEPMQIGYEAEGGKVLKPTEIVEGDRIVDKSNKIDIINPEQEYKPKVQEAKREITPDEVKMESVKAVWVRGLDSLKVSHIQVT